MSLDACFWSFHLCLFTVLQFLVVLFFTSFYLFPMFLVIFRWFLSASGHFISLSVQQRWIVLHLLVIVSFHLIIFCLLTELFTEDPAHWSQDLRVL